jgi:hypothetical protein
VALQLVGELTVIVTLILQLPDGFGPNVMPPFSENRIGNASALFCKIKLVDTVTLGLPLMVISDTAQFAGVTVSVELSLPFPELSSVNMKSPFTAIVPP